MGLKRFFHYIWSVLPYAKGSREEMLNLYQYKFLRFKEVFDNEFPLDISGIYYPCEKGLVSVILPVYNGEGMLGQSVDSVLRQSHKSFELIIINDGSKDKTGEIADGYARRDARIRVIHQENRKIPRTLSRGFREAKGEFLTWTSADNIMHDDFLEKMVGALSRDADAAMVFANMRLIDGDGKLYRGHGWFEQPVASGNVMLPHSALELNVYPNNTIAAAFMYRGIVAHALGDYSSFKHTLEDYDYWMRVNSLFKLRHTGFNEPVYDYRWHKGSLTAQDKELGITAGRYRLMVLDDFRRDFYLSQLVYVVDCSEEFSEKARGFCEFMKKNNLVMTRKEALSLNIPKIAGMYVYIWFGTEKACAFDEIKEHLPHGSVFVCISNVANGLSEKFDMYFATDDGAGLPRIGGYRGWFATRNISDTAGFIERKARNALLYHLEGLIETTAKRDADAPRLSVIICTNRGSERFKNALDSALSQSCGGREYEIVVVNNACGSNEAADIVSQYEEKARRSGVALKYMDAPQKGLSYARNIGMWNASGEILLFIDDDAVADIDLVKETIKGFDQNEEAGVIGGQIILAPPEPHPAVLAGGLEVFWSQFVIKGDKCVEAKNQDFFPYGANFAVSKSSLAQIGGFRTAYGRRGNDFSGGEETVVCFMMKEIGKKVFLNPHSKVLHDVEEDRYTLHHIDKSVRAGILTNYRIGRDLYSPEWWDDNYIAQRINSARIEYEKAKEALNGGEENADFVHKRAVYESFSQIADMRNEDYGRRKKGAEGIMA